MPVTPALWKAEAGRLQRHGFAKISGVWWRTPAVPATQEAEEGKSLEPRRRRLQ